MKRIGPKMREALIYVQTHPGCSKHEVAKAVGPHGSNAFGDRVVLRTLAAGLIANRGTSSRYALYVAE